MRYQRQHALWNADSALQSSGILAKDGKLTLPAAVEPAEFAPLLLCDEQLPLSSSKTTPAARIAEIVRAWDRRHDDAIAQGAHSGASAL